MAVNIKNKKASYTYFLADEFTAGLVLSGSEIKSIRAGKASITESYCRFDQGGAVGSQKMLRSTPMQVTCRKILGGGESCCCSAPS